MTPNVRPLIMLLVLDFIVCAVWWVCTSVFGMTAPDKLLRLMIGIVVLINFVVILFWVLALVGVSLTSLPTGPLARLG